MKRYAMAAALMTSPCLLGANSASAQAISGRLTFQVLSWSAKCTRHASAPVPFCEIPTAIGKPRVFTIELAEVFQAGEADYAFKDFSVDGGAEAIQGRLTIYSVYPHTGTGLPPYTQIRLDVEKPVESFCSESVRWRQPADIPTLICGNYRGEGSSLEQVGMTLIHVPTAE